MGMGKSPVLGPTTRTTSTTRTSRRVLLVWKTLHTGENLAAEGLNSKDLSFSTAAKILAEYDLPWGTRGWRTLQPRLLHLRHL